MSHKNYTVSELADDPSFRRMARGIGNTEEIKRWNKWIEESEENRMKAKSAIAEVVGFEFDSPELPDIEQKWFALYAKTIGLQKTESVQQRRKKNETLRWLYRAVAVILVLSMVGLGIYHFNQDVEDITHLEQLTQQTTITTGDGEQKTLTFSNGSRVVLNRNSTLTYSISLLQNQTIDVELEGEAWFVAESVSSTGLPVFAIATPDGIIRNIGTKFLVTVQREWSQVVLQEGSVEIELFDRGHSKNQKFSINKGERVEFSRANILAREIVNPTFYTSWATKFMQFDQTGIHEFADFVEQRFDVKVQIGNPDLKDITLDGAVYFSNLDDLVRSVSKVTGLAVSRSEDGSAVYIGEPYDSKLITQ